jgi:para-nitrobenzyl esterase
MARHNEVMQVSINHCLNCLNCLGFFDAAEIGRLANEDCENVGKTDLVAASRWVHEKIASTLRLN